MLTDEQIEELAKGRRYSAIDVDDDTVVLCAPSRAAIDRWTDSEKKQRDHRVLVDGCRLHPDKDAFTEILDRYPMMLAETFAVEVVRLAGLGKGIVRRRTSGG